MNMEQRVLLSEINASFGSLLFISDDVSEYREEQLQALRQAFAPREVQILQAGLEQENIMYTAYLVNGERRELRFDIRTGESDRL